MRKKAKESKHERFWTNGIVSVCKNFALAQMATLCKPDSDNSRTTMTSRKRASNLNMKPIGIPFQCECLNVNRDNVHPAVMVISHLARVIKWRVKGRPKVN